MEIRHKRHRLFLLYSLPLNIAAFHPCLESLKGGSMTSRTTIPEHYDGEREREHGLESQNSNGSWYSECSFHTDKSYVHNELDFFQGGLFTAENFRIDSNMFGIDNPFDIPVLQPTSITSKVFDTCSGDDCEECFIPDEYKHVENAVDALIFLGIQRAKPIVTTMVDD